MLGLEVALEGDTAMLGAPVQRGDNSIDGFVYVFTRSGGSWSRTQRFSASDGAAGEQFGDAVSMDGDLAVVGAPDAEVSVSGAGAAYVFQKSGGNWSEEQKLTSPSPKEYARFGIDVALNGSSALIGASSPSAIQPARAGAAHLFEQSGGSWSQSQRLTACDGSSDNEFGSSVALRQNLALVGAPGAVVDLPMAPEGDSGAVYAYASESGTWTHADKLAVESTADFGTSMALDGERLVVGDPDFVAQPDGGSLTTEAGRAFAFSVDSNPTAGGDTVCEGDPSGDAGIGPDAGGGNGMPNSGSGCSTSGQAPTMPFALLGLLGLGLVARRE